VLKSESNISFLDGTRGLAALAVLCSHIYNGCFKSFPTFNSIVISAGHSSVELFFVLSGFLIGAQFWKSSFDKKEFNYRNYFMRRALRVLPLFYISCFIFFVAFVLLKGNLGDKSIIEIIPFYLFQIQNFFSDINIINPPTWTVAVEIHFYLFIALFFYLLRKRSIGQQVIYIILLCLIVIIYRYWAYLQIEQGGNFRNLFYANSFARMDHFFLGTLLAMAYQKIVKGGLQIKYAGIVLFVLGILLHIGLIYTEHSFVNEGSTISSFLNVNILGIVTALAWSILLLSCTFGFTPLVKVLSLKPLSFCGKISYSLYLFQLPIYSYAFKPTFVKLFSQHNFWCATAYIPVIIGLSTLSYYFIEMKFLKLKVKIR